MAIYQFANAQLAQDREFDEIFCVFDRDSHPSFDEAMQAIKGHRSKKLSAIASYPCFEFWVLLHFRFTRVPFIRSGKNSPGEMVMKALRTCWPEYAKGDPRVFIKLSEPALLEFAISNAKQARLDAHQTGEANPSTDVDLLINKLREVASEQVASTLTR